jgi:hypothetical protein
VVVIPVPMMVVLVVAQGDFRVFPGLRSQTSTVAPFHGTRSYHYLALAGGQVARCEAPAVLMLVLLLHGRFRRSCLIGYD